MRIVTGSRQYQKYGTCVNFGTGFAILGLAVFFCPFLRKNAINRKNAALRQAEETPLKIAKVLNNNIVIAVNERGEDVIAMGCGIAFGKKRGDALDPAKVERLFTNSVPELSGRFEELAKAIPAEYIEAAEKVIATVSYTHLTLPTNSRV